MASYHFARVGWLSTLRMLRCAYMHMHVSGSYHMCVQTRTRAGAITAFGGRSSYVYG